MKFESQIKKNIVGEANSDTVLANGSKATKTDVWSVWSVCVFVSVGLLLGRPSIKNKK